MEVSDNPFKIYKSSAGSGKTYTLVLSFLTLILKNDDLDKFKKILAITFTNKASQEMKERILEGLDLLIHQEDQDFVKHYVKATQLSADILKIKAEKLQKRILHNYSSLNIETIDKFVHKIIRAFSRELGLNSNFELETNVDDFLTRCIDDLIETVGENDELTKTLLRYTKNLVDFEQGSKIEQSLTDMVKLLKSDSNSAPLKAYEDKGLDFFESTKKELRGTIEETSEAINDYCQSIESLFAGFDMTFVKNGNSTHLKGLLELIKNIEVSKDLSDPQIKHIKAGTIMSAKNQEAHPTEANIYFSNAAFIEEKILAAREAKKLYFLYRDVDKNLVAFSLLNNIRQLLTKIKTENNVVFVSDFNEIISKVIKDEPTPYIYEKIGNRYDHYFIDEFQDTSELQWNNLIPLVNDSLSYNRMNLIVGDAKQSIYRWRGGNANQFIALPNISNDIADKDDINRTFNRCQDEQRLDSNYRSAINIINFNNWLFDSLKVKLSEYSNIQKVYEDVNQKITKKEEGLVQVSILPKQKTDDETNYKLEQLEKDILESKKAGYEYGDMCIIVRKNKFGSEVAKHLTSLKIKVTSQDSLLLSESVEIQSIYNFFLALHHQDELSVVKYFYNNASNSSVLELFKDYRIPNKKNSMYSDGFEFNKFIEDYFPDFNLTHYDNLSIYDKVDYIAKRIGIDKGNLFVDKLLNYVFDFQNKFGHNIGKFIIDFDAQQSKLSVASKQSEDAIQIMTIHKSKGLQFPVVFLPQGFGRELDNDIWVSSPELSSIGLENFSLRLGDKNTINSLVDSKNDNKELKLLDGINMLYVGVTRAVSRLYVNITESKKGDTWSFPSNFDHVISDHIGFNNETQQLIIGDPTNEKILSAKKGSKSISLTDRKLTTTEWRTNLKLSLTPSAQDEELKRFSDIEKGNAVHTILQNLDDLKTSEEHLENILANNSSYLSIKDELTSILNKFCSHPEIKSFYTEMLDIQSERSFIGPDGSLLIPDKIIEKESHVILLDFKTGVPLPKHKNQIMQYNEGLSKLYKKEIKSYLVYLTPESVSVEYV